MPLSACSKVPGAGAASGQAGVGAAELRSPRPSPRCQLGSQALRWAEALGPGEWGRACMAVRTGLPC